MAKNFEQLLCKMGRFEEALKLYAYSERRFEKNQLRATSTACPANGTDHFRELIMSQDDPHLDLWYQAEKTASLSHPYPKIDTFSAGFIVATASFIATYIPTLVGIYDFQHNTGIKEVFIICGFCLGSSFVIILKSNMSTLARRHLTRY